MEARRMRAECHGRWKHDRQLLHRVEKPGPQNTMTVVGQLIIHRKPGFARAQGEAQSVMPRLLFHGRGCDFYAAGARAGRQNRRNGSFCRQIKLKGTFTCLGQRRSGIVLDVIHVGNMKRVAFRADPHDCNLAAYAFHSRRGVKDINSDIPASSGLAIVVHRLMHHANQVAALGKLHVEAKAALGAGLGARLFLHSVQ